MNQSAACCSPTESYETLGTNVWIYGSPVLVTLGTIGNLISGMVMQRKQQRKLTTSFYLTYLAFLDTAILYTGLPRQWILAVYKIDIRDETSVICKLHMFLMYYLVQVEGWLLACVALERAAAVWLPVRAKLIFTRRFALIQVASMNAFLFAADVHIFWTQALVPENDGHVCRIPPEYFSFRIDVWGWIDMTLASILPFTVMLTCNTAVIIRIFLQTYARSQGASQQGRVKIQSITFMLLTVCLAFFLSSLPITIYLSDTDVFFERYGCCVSRYVWWPIINMFFYMNNTINFILYCASGRKFREELGSMFGCRTNVVAPQSSM